jgi:hypothetical protein
LDFGHFLATFGGDDQLFDRGIDLTDRFTRGGKMTENKPVRISTGYFLGGTDGEQ